MKLLEVNNLRVRFDTPRGAVQAVDQVSLSVDRGEMVALVGESGSGKSMTGYAIVGLVPLFGGVVETGEVWFDGKNLLRLAAEEMRKVRGDALTLILQDPSSALNPFLTIGVQLAEVLETHRGLSRKDALVRAARALGDVGVSSPEERLAGFPHQLSGGLRQRVLIAMAMLTEPKLIIADEPTTALDVTLQAQVLELLRDLREKRGTGVLFITHDLSLVAAEADRLEVMYAGRIVEAGETREVFREPWHPYTKGLLASRPSIERVVALTPITGQAADLAALPAGCAFEPRCPFAVDRCRRERPVLSGLVRNSPGEFSLSSDRRTACF